MNTIEKFNLGAINSLANKIFSTSWSQILGMNHMIYWTVYKFTH